MITKILIPTDFSPAAWHAVQYGLKLAAKLSAEVTLLHVYPSQNKYMSWLKTQRPEDPAIIEQLNNKMKEFTEELKAGKDQVINYSVTSGYVTTEILNFTKEHSYDLIILGVNSGDTNNQPGSNTAEIIRNAGFPVMVIPGAGNTKAAVA